MESFTVAIQNLMENRKDFLPKFKQRLVRESNILVNPFKFIVGLFTEGVLAEVSNDLEACFGLNEVMVPLAITTACSQGAGAIGGLFKALEDSGNSQIISALRTWAKEDFGIESDGELSEPKEAATSALQQAPPRKKLRKNVTSPTEFRSSSGANLMDMIMSHVPDDLIEQLEGQLVGKASDIVNAAEFCTRPTAAGLFAATTQGLISLDLQTLEATALTSEYTIAVAVNHYLKKVYWSEDHGNSRIMRSNFDGSAKETIFSPTGDTIRALAIDEGSGNVYFAFNRSHKIKVCNALGGNSAVVLDDGSLVNRVSNIVLDCETGYMYWSTFCGYYSPHYIVRAHLNGSNATIVSTGFTCLSGMTLDDASNQVLYWVDGDEQKIGTIDVNSGEKRTLLELKNSYTKPHAIQVDQYKIYFSGLYRKDIQSTDRDSGQNLTTIFQSTTEKVWDLALFNKPVKLD